MNPAEYEAKLRNLQKELSERLERVDDHIKHRAGPVSADFEDQATERQNDEVVIALNDNLVVELQAISEALKRIENNTFGICTKCGDEIAPARLDAIPWAAVCVNCKSPE